MSTHRHIIQVGEFEIRLADEGGAKFVFETINRLNAGPLTDLIEQYLDSYCTEQETHRIEKLELDLGTIPASSFEQKFLTRFEEKLAGALKSAIEKDGGNKERSLHRADADLELFVFYLNYGALPWWANSKEPGLLQQVLQRLIDSRASQLKHVLHNLIQKPNVRRRLAIMNRSPGFMEIVQVLSDQTLLLHDAFPIAVASWRGFSVRKAITLWRETFLKTFVSHQQSLDLAFFKNISEALGYPLSDLIAGIEIDLAKPGKKTPEELMVLIKKVKSLHLEKPITKTDSVKGIKGIAVKEKTGLISDASTRYPTDSDSINSIQSIAVNEKSGLTSDASTRDTADDLTSKIKQDDKLINKPVNLTYSESEELYLDNAGIVLLCPFLPRFFQALRLIENNDWINSEARQKGIAALHFLVYGLSEVEEYQTPLLKVLCGLLPDDPLEDTEPLTDETRNECTNLLESVIAHASVLGSISIDGFRSSFLLRPGLLTTREGNWLVQVERTSYDILLDKLPWSFKMIKLPWVQQFIITEW